MLENELKQNIAHNITALRKKNNMTQAELAEQLNYSDKSISKWERGESLPDIGVLKRIADIFEVTVDDLLHENVSLSQEKLSRERERRRNQILISGLAILAVWIVVTVVYIYGMVYVRGINLWTLFVWAVPLSAAVVPKSRRTRWEMVWPPSWPKWRSWKSASPSSSTCESASARP
jgi:transcriptional regulator with XRE-family HTH domain